MIAAMPRLSPGLIVGHLRRWQRARRLGLPFTRRATFKVPEQLKVGSQVIKLSVSKEVGTRNDFIAIFLSNMYMIEDLRGISTILDIGANHGLFSIYARTLFPDAKNSCLRAQPGASAAPAEQFAPPQRRGVHARRGHG
jgi:hypothetical protein